MNANRNQPCPCGSGKKFKKCCLNKQNVIQLHEVKEERFYQQKQRMVGNVRDFLDRNQSFGELKRIESEFNHRINRSMSEKTRKPFFYFWLHFFYKFENGLRGIEWYRKENKDRLLPDELAMVDTWVNLRPVIVQAVEIKGDRIVFEDVLSKQTYPVANSKENIYQPIPWYGTIGLLEEFDQKYYFNGARSFIGPKEIERAVKKVAELVEEKKGTAEEIMMNFFPEILAASIQEEERPEQERQKVMTEYFSTFYVKDTEAVKQFLSQRSDMNQDNHLYSWSGNWVAYRDSELDKEVGIGEVFGSISLKGNELSFNTLNEEKLSEFQQILQTNVEVESVKTEEKHLTIPYYAEVSNMILSMDHTIPKYFSLYAQHRNMLNIDAAIPAYDNLSLRN